jgi:hypothetical protein
MSRRESNLGSTALRDSASKSEAKSAELAAGEIISDSLHEKLKTLVDRQKRKLKVHAPGPHS